MNNLNTNPFTQWHPQIDPPKTHNCPNCQCTNNHPQNPNPIIISRQQSPIISRPTNKLFINQPNILIKSHSPQNIYFQRTDLNTSNSSIKSNTSLSKQKNIQTTKVNIRFCSPSRNSITNFNTPITNTPQIIYPQINKIIHQQPKQPQNKYTPSLYHFKTHESNNKDIEKQQITNWNQDEPPTPNILKRKTSAVKKSTQFGQKNLPSPRINKYHEFDRVSAILKNLPTASDHQNKEIIGSAYKMLLEDSQQKALMQELSNDLKLNYDYLETADISNDSVS